MGCGREHEMLHWPDNIVNCIVSAATLEIAINNVVLMSFFSRLCPCFYKGGATSGDGGEHHDDHSGPADSLDLIFDLHTLQLATNFFSSLNQLGHGGFGPVFKVPYPFLLFKFPYLISCFITKFFSHWVLGSCHFNINYAFWYSRFVILVPFSVLNHESVADQ